MAFRNLVTLILTALVATNTSWSAEETTQPTVAPSPLERAHEMFVQTLPSLDSDFDRALISATAAERIGGKAPDVTLKLLQQARDARFGFVESPESRIILKKLVSAFATVDPYQALLLSEQIDNDGEREFLLSEIAVPVLTVDRKLAFLLADSLEIPIHRVDAMTSMASALIQTDEEAAKRLLNGIAKDFPSAQPRVDALDAAGEFLPLMHRLGVKQFAAIKEAALGEIGDSRDREELSRAQAALAPVVALDDLEAALELLEETPQLDYRAVSTAKIGAVIRERDRSRSSLLFKQAIDLAGSGSSGFYLDDPIPDVARVIAQHKPVQAFRFALLTGDRAIRLDVCREILIAANEKSGLKMLESMIKEDYVSHMLIVAFYARHGELTGAEEKIDAATKEFMALHEFLRDENLPVFLGDLAVWDAERALQVSADTKEPRVRLAALTEVMVTLAD